QIIEPVTVDVAGGRADQRAFELLRGVGAERTTDIERGRADVVRRRGIDRPIRDRTYPSGHVDVARAGGRRPHAHRLLGAGSDRRYRANEAPPLAVGFLRARMPVELDRVSGEHDLELGIAAVVRTVVHDPERP